MEPGVFQGFIESSSQLECDLAKQIQAIGDERSTMCNLWSLFPSSSDATSLRCFGSAGMRSERERHGFLLWLGLSVRAALGLRFGAGLGAAE
jgi:hypothetical protein